MKRTILLAGFAIACLFYSCGKDKSPTPAPPVTPPVVAPLAITDFNPKAAMVGTSIMITGTAFGTDTNAVAVSFGGSPTIKPKTITSTQLNVNVPKDAVTGKITITIKDKTITSADNFTLTATPPPPVTVTGFTPQTAEVGQTVTITGTQFGTDTNFVAISFGGSVKVKPKTVTPTTFTVIVPGDAKTGKISVSVNDGAAVSTADNFTLKPSSVVISYFSPKIFTEHDTITITGKNFRTDAAVFVFFENNKPIRPFKVTPTSISVDIPYDADHGTKFTGKIKVTVYERGEASASESYIFLPPLFVLNVNPKSARPGKQINLSLSYNHVSYTNNPFDINALSVKFGSSAAIKPTADKDGTLILTVPKDAQTGKITVTAPDYAAGISSFTFTALPTLPPLPSGIWTARADFGNEGLYGMSSFTIKDKAYLVGGAAVSGFGGWSNELVEYDPLDNAWTKKANYGGGSTLNGVAFSIGTKGYVGTGSNTDNQSKNDFWEYDSETNVWTQKANFKGSKRSSAVGFSIGNKGYIGSGYDSNDQYMEDFYAYDPATNSWSIVAPIPKPRSGAIAFVIDNKAYVGNGFYLNASKSYINIADLYAYDPATNSWTAKAAIPGSPYAANSAAFTVNGKGYVGFGRQAGAGGPLISTKNIYEYNPITNTWKSAPAFGGEPRSYATGFAIGDVGYFCGGVIDGGTAAYKDVWALKP